MLPGDPEPTIFDLKLTNRVSTVLTKVNLLKLDDVCKHPAKFYLAQDNFGLDALNELVSELRKVNRTLATN